MKKKFKKKRVAIADKLKPARPTASSILHVKKERADVVGKLRSIRPLNDTEKSRLKKTLKKIETGRYYDRGWNRVEKGFVTAKTGDFDSETIDVFVEEGIKGGEIESEKIVVDRKSMDVIENTMASGGYTKQSGQYSVNVHGQEPTDYKIICKVLRIDGKDVQVCYHETNDKTKKGVEVYSGKNYIVDSNAPSYSKRYDLEDTPVKYKVVVDELIKAHHKRLEGGGKMEKGGKFGSSDLPKDGSEINIHMPKMGHLEAEDIVLKYDKKNFAFNIYVGGKKVRQIGEKEVIENLNNGLYVLKSGGESRMYNFLEDDLRKLEEAINTENKEEIEKFFSYWSYHLKSLKTKTNDRMYNFLKEDLEKLEKAVSEGDKEEVERFFSYWGRHLKSLKMAKGGSMGSEEMSEAETKQYIGNLSEEDWNRLKPENKEKYKKYRNNKSSGGSMATGGKTSTWKSDINDAIDKLMDVYENYDFESEVGRPMLKKIIDELKVIRYKSKVDAIKELEAQANSLGDLQYLGYFSEDGRGIVISALDILNEQIDNPDKKWKGGKMKSGGKLKHSDLIKKIDAQIKKHKADENYDEYGEEINKIYKQFDKEVFKIDDDQEAQEYLLGATAPEQLEYLKERIQKLGDKKMAHGGKTKEGKLGVSVVISPDEKDEYKEIAKKHNGKHMGQQRVGREVELNFQFNSESEAKSFFKQAKTNGPIFIHFDDSFIRKEDGGRMAGGGKVVERYRTELEEMKTKELARELEEQKGFDYDEVFAQLEDDPDETRREDFIDSLVEEYERNLKSRGEMASGGKIEIPRLKKDATWKDVKEYLEWLWDSHYQYHIDDNPEDVFDDKEVIEVLTNNSDIMWKFSEDGKKGTKLWDVYYKDALVD